MGNSPSRNELHGDHMSSIANNSSGQETFQSHSYPAKFSSVPGIHNEQFNAALPVRSAERNQQQQSKVEEASGSNSSGSGTSTRNGTQSSGGPNTPDLLYSMDSLNVCGNNSSSITSAELPPSSISPARDPWSASSYSDESINTQCRNLSRLHKDLHHRPNDDEGLSSSTYESDSLNPDATLSGMHHKQEIIHPFELNHQNTILRREISPAKTEVAQEATEEIPLTKSNNGSASNLLIQSTTSGDITLSSSTTSNGIDHSITINGRKVSGGEDTPLPIIVGLTQAEADQANGNCVSSKIGITSAEINTPPPLPAAPPPTTAATNGNGIYSMGTIKRGSRMKSPPPPPPPLVKQVNGSGGGGITFQAGGDSETIDKKMSSLNTLMCRNVEFGSRSRKCNGVETVTEDEKDTAQLDVESDEVNVIKTPSSSSSHQQQEKTTKSTTSLSSARHGYAQDEAEDMLLSKNPCKNGNTTKQSEKSGVKTEVVEKQQIDCSRKAENDADDDSMKEADKVEANKHPTALISNNFAEEVKDDDNTEVLIRPCKGSKQSDEGVITSNDNSQFSIAPINSLKKDSVVGSVGEKVNKEEEEEKLVKSIENETVNEQNSLNHISVDINKTELDCKDGKDDSIHFRVTPTNATTAATCNNPHEIMKPVSCSSNVNEEKELLNRIDEENSLLMLSSSSYKNSTDKIMIDGNKANEENLNVDDGFVSVAGLDFPKICDKQLETVPMFGVSSTILNQARLDKKVNDGCGGIYSKFGTKEHDSNNGWGEFLSRENTPVRQEQPSSSSSSSSPTAVASCEGDVLLRGGNKSEKSSNSSSRRGSLSASSVDLNVLGVVQQQNQQNTSSNGILSCNRISLCSLPDNEMDVDNFESPTMHGSEAIQDQPIACQTNYEMLNSSSGDEDTNQSLRIEKDKAENDVCEKVEKKGGCFHENSKNVHGSSHHHHHHQRKLSVSKIDFNSFHNQGKNDGKSTVSSSAPVASAITSLFDKNVVSRKGSFPELYVNTSTVRSLRRKLSVGNELYSSSRENLNGPSFKTTNPFFSDENDTTKGYHVSNDNDKSLSAKNDFLQTLGEIYASKSKLFTNKIQSTPSQAPVLPITEPSNSKETIVPLEDTTATSSLVSMEKTKSRDASIETVDGYECQDRSISEYNISPRSARELVTESLINGTSSLSSTVSQKSIVTINDSDVIAVSSTAISAVAPVPFSTGVDDGRKNPFGADITGPADAPVVVIPQLSQSSSLGSNHSATYKKKPSFIRGRVSKGNATPCVEIFEPSSSPKTTANTIDQKYSAKEKDEQTCNGPVPPPMPCLQFSRNNSYSSTASSSNGDSVDSHSEKCKSPCYGDRKIVIDKLGRRSSPEKNAPKVNGNTSSECSLIEVNLANQKSTSDAIILELKKAQARKLKFAEEKSADLLLSDMPQKNETKQCFENQPRTVAIVEVYEQSDKRLEDLHKKSPDEHLCGSVSTYQQPVNHHDKLVVEDPPVKAIVNGKHTNSIIVNETPVVITKKESFKKPRSGVYATKSLISQQRGNIMSPSLSGNYTEMNGIDSETMGASSIHEDELSGQLQQKENHINELHGNLAEVQTSNKLDGASFRRVLSEYEKTLSMFIQQIDQLKTRMDEAETEKQTLIKEKDQALEDLRNVESAFSDVHRKYERAKALLENMKSNEDTLIRRDQEMMQRIQNRDKKIDLIKEKAQESIEKMHLDYETRIKEMEFENAKLRAQYRKMEMKLSTLENDVEQKAKENAQLSALCDELINGQVGQV